MLGPNHFIRLTFPDNVINLQKISYNFIELVQYNEIMDSTTFIENDANNIQYKPTHLSTESQEKKINVYILKHQVFSKLNEEDSLLLITNIHGIDSNLVKDIKCNNLYILMVRVISIHII